MRRMVMDPVVRFVATAIFSSRVSTIALPRVLATRFGAGSPDPVEPAGVWSLQASAMRAMQEKRKDLSIGAERILAELATFPCDRRSGQSRCPNRRSVCGDASVGHCVRHGYFFALNARNAWIS